MDKDEIEVLNAHGELANAISPMKPPLSLREELFGNMPTRRTARRKLRAEQERDKLREVARKLIEYRDRVGGTGFQLEKADDFINELRKLI